ncbi:MAG: hypothetical protein ACXW14_04595 [Burkholderiaceae bacterium]
MLSANEYRPGRVRGSDENKRTLNVMERLDELGIDPLEGMAKIALNPQNRSN